MQIVTGIVLLLKFCLSGVIGARLLRLPDRDRLSPERCLGWFFLIAELLGGLLVTVAYGIWAGQGQAESSGMVSQIHAYSQLALSFGYAMVLLFTQRTFYPESKAAAIATWTVIAVLVASLLGRTMFEGFAVSLQPGVYHWMGFYCRMIALLAASVAAHRYWIQMKRRSALGLADPMVANRFLLWELWATGSLLIAFAEPVSRIVYGWITGADAAAAESITAVAGSLITVVLCITSVLGLATTTVLFLAFFPTDGYRSWIKTRASTSARG